MNHLKEFPINSNFQPSSGMNFYGDYAQEVCNYSNDYSNSKPNCDSGNFKLSNFLTYSLLDEIPPIMHSDRRDRSERGPENYGVEHTSFNRQASMGHSEKASSDYFSDESSRSPVPDGNCMSWNSSGNFFSENCYTSEQKEFPHHHRVPPYWSSTNLSVSTNNQSYDPSAFTADLSAPIAQYPTDFDSHRKFENEVSKPNLASDSTSDYVSYQGNFDRDCQTACTDDTNCDLTFKCRCNDHVSYQNNFDRDYQTACTDTNCDLTFKCACDLCCSSVPSKDTASPMPFTAMPSSCYSNDKNNPQLSSDSHRNNNESSHSKHFKMNREMMQKRLGDVRKRRLQRMDNKMSKMSPKYLACLKERQRSAELQMALQQLHDKIPSSVKKGQRMSKITTLKLAISYIYNLESSLLGCDNANYNSHFS